MADTTIPNERLSKTMRLTCDVTPSWYSGATEIERWSRLVHALVRGHVIERLTVTRTRIEVTLVVPSDVGGPQLAELEQRVQATAEAQ